MPDAESTPPLRCDLCDRPLDEPEVSDELRVELSREDGQGQPEFWVADFCSQDHAARWLGRPLPPPVDVMAAPVPLTWRDRAATTGCALVVLAVVALLVVGAWTTGRFLFGGS